MSALDWIADKATPLPVDFLDVTDEMAAEAGIQPGRYRIESKVFEGNLPTRMMAQLRRSHRPLVSDELTHETLHLGNGYRSGYCQCRYSITHYVLAS